MPLAEIGTNTDVIDTHKLGGTSDHLAEIFNPTT